MFAIVGASVFAAVLVWIMPPRLRQGEGSISLGLALAVFFGSAALAGGSRPTLWFGACGFAVSTLPLLWLGSSRRTCHRPATPRSIAIRAMKRLPGGAALRA
jgi:hypothetical protein